MIAVTGLGTTIVAELSRLLPDQECRRIVAGDPVPRETDRFVFAAGILRSKMVAEQTAEEIAEALRVNVADHLRLCEAALAASERARICIVGSESGFKGSFDMAYTAAKAAMHRYVETRRVGPGQQLVAVAPAIISDSGMTRRRPDYASTMLRGRDAPRGRWITSAEVAAAIRWLLWSDEGFWVNNTVLWLNGGLAA